MRLYDYTAYPRKQTDHAIYGEVLADSERHAKAKVRALCPRCKRIELSVLSEYEPAPVPPGSPPACERKAEPRDE